MSLDLFAEPDFLALLRFWENSRRGRDLPSWNGDPARLPRVLLPNVVISERHPEPVYAYVGHECARRWGGDVTGRHLYDEVLTGPLARYIRSLEEDALARRAPIFSAAIYGRDENDLILTGRLFAPFTDELSPTPCYVMGVQIFRGSALKLSALGGQGFAEEVDRQMITATPLVCDRLEKARHWEIAARGFPRREVAEPFAEAARDLAREALVPLPRFTVTC
jgi:hypothetical protein